MQQGLLVKDETLKHIYVIIPVY